MLRPCIYPIGIFRHCAVLALVAALLLPALTAQQPFYPSPDAPTNPANPPKSKHRSKQEAAPSSGPTPRFSIPVTPYGFSPPSASYLGHRFAQLSLDFLTEDTLLFTFRVPGLIPRSAVEASHSSVERNIRALVVSLPDGRVTAEALWTLHDYAPYLAALPGESGTRFLLRDRNQLQIGDASLTLKPYLRFPGPVINVALEPTRHFLIANTTENQPADPAKSASGIQNETAAPGSTSSPIGTPSSASASIVSSSQEKPVSSTAPNSILRILRLDTGKVQIFSHVAGPTHLAVDGEGYYEALRGKGAAWLIVYNHFNGAVNSLASVDSVCSPALEAVAHGIVLASACFANGSRHLTAITQSQHRLWDLTLPPTEIWPLLAESATGLRIVRSTLEVSHPVGPATPLDNSDIRGQLLQVHDLADGHLTLSLKANPILDAGGNFALSPSGNRFAFLRDGKIDVFDLPPAPPIPNTLVANP